MKCVAFILEMMFSNCVSGDDSDSPGRSTTVEGKIKPTSEVLEGLGFSQVVSSAIAFSFVYHNRHKDKGSLIPTIQVSRGGFDVFFYDCVNDILIGQIFHWSHISLMFLWAILNYRIIRKLSPKQIWLPDNGNFWYGLSLSCWTWIFFWRKYTFVPIPSKFAPFTTTPSQDNDLLTPNCRKKWNF